MRAIDTNVVVRFLTRDDEAHFKRASAALRAGDIFVSTTVVLETEWVLRSAYGYAKDRIVEALRGVAGLPGLRLEDPERIDIALDRLADGMDFADALHLGAAADCEVFLTFDRKLAKVAEGQAGPRVAQP